jgi:hypothetical protein
MSKAIYQPKGKAQEYNQWAVNFFNGCSGKWLMIALFHVQVIITYASKSKWV